MHGVSDPFITQAFEIFGFKSGALCKVEAQRLPDPEFPTVAFPNPEEKGMLHSSYLSILNHVIQEQRQAGIQVFTACR